MTLNQDESSRRHWDVEAYANRARERERAEKQAEGDGLRSRKAPENRNPIEGDPFAPTRAWLRKRDYEIDLDSKVGATEVVNSTQGGGFRCSVCDVTMKDSNRFLNHVNSRLHQKRLGISMRVKRSTAIEVRGAFAEALREKKAEERKRIRKPYTPKDGLPNGSPSPQCTNSAAPQYTNSAAKKG